ncbi:hypothetical protein POUND7_004663 [Theobroma cacao]
MNTNELTPPVIIPMSYNTIGDPKGGMAKSYFKQEHDLEKRRAEAARIREKYPDRIPVIVERAERSDIPNIDKKK